MLFPKFVILPAAIVFFSVGIFMSSKAIWEYWNDKPRKQSYGEETLVQRGFIPLGQWGKRDTTKRTNSERMLTVESGTVFIKDTDFFQKGNIQVSGTGRLIFENSVVEITPKDSLRASIVVKDKGEIVFENSTLKPHADDPGNLFIYASDEAKFTFSDSQGLHKIVAEGDSVVRMDNSIWVYSSPDFRGGGIAVRDAAKVQIKDSFIGGLTLELPADAEAIIDNFIPQKFERIDLREKFKLTGVAFDIILENTEITSDYLQGANERGLSIHASVGVKNLTIHNSEINRLVFTGEDENLAFENLLLEKSTELFYNNISIKDSKIMAQWGFLMNGGEVKISASNGIGLFVSNESTLVLDNTEVNELNARNFNGIIAFKESILKDSGAITENSDFLWRGSWFAQGFDRKTFAPFVFMDSQVRREFLLKIFSLDVRSVPIAGALVEVSDKDNRLLQTVFTDGEGVADFSILFNEENYKDRFYLKVSKNDRSIKHEVNFFTPTPVTLLLK